MLPWKSLCHLSDEELAKIDVAEVNLACAEGLPGAESIPYAECIDRLNHYAYCVRQHTERRMLEFYRQAEKYDYSEAKFRVVWMISVLQKLFGVRYNPAKKPMDVPLNTADKFIHGTLVGEGGTCASLPVVYTAVGRRVGYPLKLVSCRGHLFCRWEESGGERFNIEVNDRTIDDPPDDDYRKGIYETSPWEEKAFCYLQSQTPKMELAGFLKERGLLLLKEERLKEAAESFLWASSLVPHNEMHPLLARRALEAWKERVGAMRPPQAPEITVFFPQRRRWPDTLPLAVEHWFILIETVESTLKRPRNQPWWEALRRAKGYRPNNIPTKIEIRLAS